MAITTEQLLARRDKKVQDMFYTLAPVWLTHDSYRPNEDSYLFNLAYRHPVDGWISERIKYDTYSDVLYHMGTRYLSDQAVLEIQDGAPYVAGRGTASIPNNPGSRY